MKRFQYIRNCAPILYIMSKNVNNTILRILMALSIISRTLFCLERGKNVNKLKVWPLLYLTVHWEQMGKIWGRFLVKFIYFEKATKFCKIFTLILSYVVQVKSKVKISQNFVVFSEYMNFTKISIFLEHIL